MYYIYSETFTVIFSLLNLRYSSSLCWDSHSFLDLIQFMVQNIFRRILCQSKVHNLHATKCHKLFLLICQVNCLLSAVHFTLENKQFPDL